MKRHLKVAGTLRVPSAFSEFNFEANGTRSVPATLRTAIAFYAVIPSSVDGTPRAPSTVFPVRPDNAIGLRIVSFLVAAYCAAIPLFAFAQSAPPSAVRFARDIRPVFAEHCFTCHGPDKNKREAELRLDLESEAKREVDGKSPIVPGQLAKSEVWRRIISNDPDERMPPPDSGHALSAAEVERIRQWITEGATWEKHWSFIPPERTLLPKIKSNDWARNAVDLFVMHKLESLDLPPSPEAEKEILIRRVSFDLTGLPPTLAEIDAFLADTSPNAYEQLVERLLASPRYGERMAAVWLDGARYADTSGYQNDGPRTMWRWRDWVIDAYNRNQPFDQFTVEQIAGDLLPGATREQHIATGFNRNHRGNAEGGIIPEEYQVEYVVDRVDTTCTVWLGLTMGCARCHDHKYDPLLQKEFYSVFAYFNNIPEYGRAIKEGNSPPYLSAPTPEQERKLADVDRHLEQLRSRWDSLQKTLSESQLQWEAADDSRSDVDWSIERGLTARFQFETPPTSDFKSDNPANVIDAYRFANGEAAFQPGLHGQAAQLDGQRCVESPDAGNFGYFDRFSVALWVNPKSVAAGTLVSRMTDEEQGDGWYVQLNAGHVQVNLVKRWLDDAIRIETVDTIPADQWSHLAVVYDGSRLADGLRVFLNGCECKFEAQLNFLNQTFTTKEPLRIGGGNGPTGRFQGAVDDVQLFQRTLDHIEVQILATKETIPDILQIAREKRTFGQQFKLAAYYLDSIANEEFRSVHEQLLEVTEARRKLAESIPTVMVMREMDQPRPTFVLLRGEYNKPGDRVQPTVPSCLPSTPADAPNNRLGFAQWLVSNSNPLTARVAVNRIWQMYFGTGLVRSTEDFGIQGDLPSHPELLDWLASEFMDRGWNVKELHRLIVTSATYRQSSRKDAMMISRDPENRWLSRGPRFRLSAEMIRDQALAASGLLVEQLGGPSVKPYQPADLWKDLATDTAYDQDHGRNLYRRSLYTYWKRTVAPPAMTTFDAAGREACQVRSTRTNTPLQALTLLNEVSYIEAARLLAERALREGGNSLSDRLALAFRLVTSRPPRATELEVLRASFDSQLAQFQSDPQSAERLLAHGEYPRDRSLNAPELAAYTTVANLLLNLDEVVTRQ